MMSLWNRIKNKLGWGPKMLNAGNAENAETEKGPTFKERIDARGIVGILDQYRILVDDVKSLEGKDDEYLARFYDSLVEICNKGPEYSQKHLLELRKQLEVVRKNQKKLRKTMSKLDIEGRNYEMCKRERF